MLSNMLLYMSSALNGSSIKEITLNLPVGVRVVPTPRGILQFIPTLYKHASPPLGLKPRVPLFKEKYLAKIKWTQNKSNLEAPGSGGG